MTIAKIIEELEKEQATMIRGANLREGRFPGDAYDVCRLVTELAKHVSKLEQEVYKL